MPPFSEQDPSRRKKRTQSRLPSGLEKKVSTYAIAAGSAGVALLACAHPADAKVVSTKGNVILKFNASVQLDIDGDGQVDFTLSNVDSAATCTSTSGARRRHSKGAKPPLGCGPFRDVLQVTPGHTANQVWQAGSSYLNKCAADLAAGVRIGPFRPFGNGVAVLSGLSGTSEGNSFCPWSQPHNPYLGVKFHDTRGNVHFGWIRVSVKPDYPTVIQGYGYETEAGKPILAGATAGAGDEAALLGPEPGVVPQALEPVSLGRLAQGASGLAAWRHEIEVEAK
jgi:hypothetical protein